MHWPRPAAVTLWRHCARMDHPHMSISSVLSRHQPCPSQTWRRLVASINVLVTIQPASVTFRQANRKHEGGLWLLLHNHCIEASQIFLIVTLKNHCGPRPKIFWNCSSNKYFPSDNSSDDDVIHCGWQKSLLKLIVHIIHQQLQASLQVSTLVAKIFLVRFYLKLL